MATKPPLGPHPGASAAAKALGAKHAAQRAAGFTGKFRDPNANPPAVKKGLFADIKDKTVRGDLHDEKVVSDVENKTNISNANPDVIGPTGTTTTRFNPTTGKYEVVQTPTDDQRAILDRDEEISKTGRDLAEKQLANSNLGTPYTPETIARTSTGDMLADRKRIEDQVYASLTRNTERDKQRDWEQTEQTMHGRGVPLDWSNQQYTRGREAVDEHYDTLKANAMQDAVKMGGEEWQRGVGINEQVIANQTSQGLATHQGQMTDVEHLAALGTGYQPADYQPYVAPPPTTLSNPTDVKLANADLAIKKRAADAAIANMGKSSSSGTTTPPGLPTVSGP